MLPLSSDFTQVDWSTIDPTRYKGETGEAVWRTVQTGDVRLRRVSYSPGYSADHWCSRGHVIFVLVGTMTTELRDGRVVVTSAGGSYHVADGVSEHRSSTEGGVELFIVD